MKRILTSIFVAAVMAAVGSVSVASCSLLEDLFEVTMEQKSYNDYDVGMYINGVEYHNSLNHFNTHYFKGHTADSLRYSRDSLVSIRGFFEAFQRQDKKRVVGKGRYRFYFELFVRFSSIAESKEIEMTVTEDYESAAISWNNGELDKEMAFCWIEDVTNNKNYSPVRGSVSFGSYRIRYEKTWSRSCWKLYFPITYFEIAAEDKEGEKLIITDGFCKTEQPALWDE